MLSKKFQLARQKIDERDFETAKSILDDISEGELSEASIKLLKALELMMNKSQGDLPKSTVGLSVKNLSELTEKEEGEENAFIKYSFVTSVFNRFWQLKETLPKNLDVIRSFEGAQLVIADFNGDDSVEIEQYINEHFPFDLLQGRLKYCKRKEPWKKFHMSSAKNSAVRLSDGEFIFSLDADNYITRDDVELMIQHFDLFPNSVMHQTTGASPMRHSMWEKYNLFDDEGHDEHLTWDGSCGRIASSREVFEAINGYNEKFNGMGMDDIDFLLRSILNGVEYTHYSMRRPYEHVFIDNGSSNSEHVHDENKVNWEIMDECFSSGSVYVDYPPNSPVEAFDVYEPECVAHSRTAKVTLFANVFNAGDYLDRFKNDIRDIVSDAEPVSIWLMDLVGSHDEMISTELRELSQRYTEIFYLPVYKDPGLYSCWNIAIKRIKSKYIANLNIDDIRGPGWIKSGVAALDSNLTDVSSPVTVPFEDVAIQSYSQFWEMQEPSVGLTTWFENKVDYNFSGRKPEYKPLEAGYYSHEDLFQVSGDKIASFCIPNASAIWRRSIHEKIGYFDEKRYGAFTDLALWLKASADGYVFKQNQHKALFYLSPNQAHVNQKNDHLQLLSLAVRFGNANYRNLAACQLFDLSLNDGCYGSHHLLGWNWVRDNVRDYLIHNENGMLLDLFVERTFFWWQADPDRQYLYTKPWIGIIHTTPHSSQTYSSEAQNLDCLLNEVRFQKSLSYCRGLIVLTQKNSSYLTAWLSSQGLDIPVFNLFHPNIPVISNSINDDREGIANKVFHVGWHLRSFSSFARLKLPKEQKVLLIPHRLDPVYFINEVVNKELAENGMGKIDDYVGDMYSAPDDLYQQILSDGFIYNYYIQPAGSNLISESISANTKLILNRHPAFEEYLGSDYPLFYSEEGEAEILIDKVKSDSKFRASVDAHMEALKSRFSMEAFNYNLRELAKQILSNELSH